MQVAATGFQDLSLKDILIDRDNELDLWTKNIGEELLQKLPERVAEKIIQVIRTNVSALKDASYGLPTEKSQIRLSFSFTIGDLCKEVTESLAENSIIKTWIEKVKASQEQTKELQIQSGQKGSSASTVLSAEVTPKLKLNHDDWNKELRRVADQVEKLLSESINASQKAFEHEGKRLMEFSLTRPEKFSGISSSLKSSSNSGNDLLVSFWVPSANAHPGEVVQKSSSWW